MVQYILYLYIYTANGVWMLYRRSKMTVRYDKLWALMKQNKMKKSELAKAADISQYAMTKLNQSKTISMDIMVRLCKIFHCDIGDLMEVVED